MVLLSLQLASAQSECMAEESSRGAACRQNVPWAEEFRTSLNRHLLGATRGLAADGRRYTWEEVEIYYREQADAVWKAARGREMATWCRVVARLKENWLRIRWRIFARKMNRFARGCWRYAHGRIFAGKVSLRELRGGDAGPLPLPWDDYNKEDEWRVYDYNEDDGYLPDTVAYWGDYVLTDLMDANDV
ncbi:hypothetical protein N9L68_02915 [bacterium]|nr:hypothetical protein [bacterium]